MRGYMRHMGAPGPSFPRCGVVARFYWNGEYEAPCTRAAGHDGGHSDGVAFADLEHEAKIKAECERLAGQDASG